MLGTPRARATGPAFAFGWIAGLTIVSIAVVVLLGGSDTDGALSTGIEWGKVAVGVLLLVMAARQWTKRPEPGEAAPMPRWMASMDTVTPARAAALGAFVSAANPKNLALTLAASASIAQADLDRTDTALAVLVFVAIGSMTVVGSVLAHLVAGARAEAPLASIRRFMVDNKATIMMIVLLLLGAKILGDGLSGL